MLPKKYITGKNNIPNHQGGLRFSRSSKPFLPATNNVIWRLISGRRTRQSHPEARRLAAQIRRVLEATGPDSILGAVQRNSAPFCRLCKLLGLEHNFVDLSREIRDRLETEAR